MPDMTELARDGVSRLLLNLAAGRPLEPETDVGEEAFTFIRDHGLIGLMAIDAPPVLRAMARPSFARLVARQEVMVGHLQRLLRTFDSGGIRATVLKGPYVAKLSYRVPAHRTYTDVDVLVHPADLNATMELLKNDPAVSSIPAQGPKADKRNIGMADPSGVRFTLDLHWDLFSYRQLQGCARGATEWAWSKSERWGDSPLGPLWRLPDAALVCFLCTHALLDHRFRLVLFRDLKEVAQHDPPDWDAVGRFAVHWGLRSLTYVALSMAVQTTEAEVPSEFLAALRHRTVPIRLTEHLLPKTDLIRFDGHRPHPLNLAIVLLHDSLGGRLRLAARAPVAFPNWHRRVGFVAATSTVPPSASPALMVLVTTDRRRGAEVFGERLTNGLKDRGWDAKLLALSHDPSGPWVQAEYISNHEPEELGRLDPKVVWSIRRRLLAHRSAIILANGSATLQYALAVKMALVRSTKVVYASIGEPMYWSRSSTHLRIHRSLLSRVDLVIAVSESTKRQLVTGFGIDPRKVAVAPTGVPDSFFEMGTDFVRRNSLHLLFLGNLSREKNPLAAVEVVRRLSGTVPIYLKFVGEGPLQELLQERVRALGLEHAISFAGSVSDVKPFLQWSDLLILTSETEGLPAVVLEAGAAGVPAVAFDVGGTSETVIGGVTGELIARGDMEALVEAVARLGANRALLTEMGERARSFVAEGFTVDQAVDRYSRLLAEYLPDPMKPAETA